MEETTAVVGLAPEEQATVAAVVEVAKVVVVMAGVARAGVTMAAVTVAVATGVVDRVAVEEAVAQQAAGAMAVARREWVVVDQVEVGVKALAGEAKAAVSSCRLQRRRPSIRQSTQSTECGRRQDAEERLAVSAALSKK